MLVWVLLCQGLWTLGPCSSCISCQHLFFGGVETSPTVVPSKFY